MASRGEQKPKKVLMAVEDLKSTMELKKTLRKYNYEVLALSIDSCDLIFRTAGEKPDIVIIDTDIVGKISPLDAAKKIIHTYKKPVIYIINSSNEEIVDDLKRIGPCGILIKPFSEEEILHSLGIALKINKAERDRIKRLETSNTDPIMAGLDKIHEPALTINRRGAITRINNEMEFFSGYKKNEIIGRKLINFFKIPKCNPESENETAVWPDEIQFRKKSGTLKRVNINSGFTLSYRIDFEEQIIILREKKDSGLSGDLYTDNICSVFMENIDEIFFAVDRDYKIIKYNNRFAEIAKKLKITKFQLTRPLYETGNFTKMLNIGDYEDIFRTGHNRNKIGKFAGKKRTLIISYTYLPVFEEGDNNKVSAVITVIKDITAAEEMKRESEGIQREYLQNREFLDNIHGSIGGIRTSLYKIIKFVEKNPQKQRDPAFKEIAGYSGEAESNLRIFDRLWSKYESGMKNSYKPGKKS
ncbi:PAS domain-containing protein [Methanoplanus endosymbiosus]|uniref:PAS domain-containing protein n=1 Tax=Methanoplanus endosymbiosus TaxID=33865 RepID=A0A9E7PKR8_9EURY|nr:PAS domain-containing protein [Methanoplanus endosymbiosus]UUX91705.1 PAS domain-containing protein [Methanoplanus endosymbiosus]